MAAVWYRFRAELRGRWRAHLGVALIVGLAGGLTLAALAGARRTESAFARLVKATDAWDLLVNPNSGTESGLDVGALGALPQVQASGRMDGLAVAPGDPRSASELANFGIVVASDGVVAYDFGRARMVQGRVPSPDEPHEVMINPLMARQMGWSVGDRIGLVALTEAEVGALQRRDRPFREIRRDLRAGDFGERFTATVTGIGVLPDEIVVDDGFATGQMMVTPAFRDRHPETFVPYWAAPVRLKRGAADVPAVRRAVEALVPGEPIAFQSAATTRTKVERAVRPSVGALSVFGVVVALTGLLVIGQSLARQTSLDAVDNDGLRALGTTRVQLFGTSMLRATVVGVLGAAVAVALAVLVSPLTPIGAARTAEPDPGPAVDVAVLLPGFVLLAIVVVLLAAIPAWRSATTRAADGRAARPSRAATAAADLGMSVPATAGVRMALEPGRGRTAVPVRTTIVSAGLAIAVVVGAAVFATSLDHLVSTPRLFGWNWDTQMSVQAEAGGSAARDARAEVVSLLDSSRAVARWGTVSLSDVTIAGTPMPAVGWDRSRGAAVPTLVDGVLPGEGEVALGRLTQRALGVTTGDTVRARDLDGDVVPLEVVGTVVLPGLGTYPGSDKTSLGEGAVLARETLYRLGPDFGRDDFVVEFDRSASTAERDEVVGRATEIALRVDPDGFGAAGVQRPSDIVAYDRIRSTPFVLAGVLAILAAATVANALFSAVRRRRRDLAMLATLGLTRRQVSSTVAWQATTVGLCALVIGIPLGVIGGRWAWGFLADDLGTISEPQVPLLAIGLAIPAVLVLCNLVAFVPGRMAARLRPAVVLRSE